MEGKYYDYTLYLQPNLYEVEAGHRLALVIYAYEPGKATYAQNYTITVDNASVSAEIPVGESPQQPHRPALHGMWPPTAGTMKR